MHNCHKNNPYSKSFWVERISYETKYIKSYGCIIWTANLQKGERERGENIDVVVYGAVAVANRKSIFWLIHKF